MKIQFLFPLLILNLTLASSGLFGQSAPLSITLDSIRHINCLSSIGYASVEVSGGQAPYSIEWSDGQTGPEAIDLQPGLYQAYAYDHLGEKVVLNVVITEDLAVPYAAAGDDFSVLCSNTRGALSGFASVGSNFAYLWTPADSQAKLFSGTTTLKPTFSHVGAFQLRVTNVQNGCVARDTVLVSSSFQHPQAAVRDSITCLQVMLLGQYNTLNTTFFWATPAPDTLLTLNVLVQQAGVFHFVVSDTLTGCKTDVEKTITAGMLPPKVSASAGGMLTCVNNSVQLTATATPSGLSFAWSGASGFSSNLQNPVVSSPGVYQVKVTAPQSGCSASASVVVVQNVSPPGASATAVGHLTCLQATVQLFGNSPTAGADYFWTGPGGYSSPFKNPVISAPGLYRLVVTNPLTGCFSKDSVVVNQSIDAPGATATGGATITCTQLTTQIFGSSPTTGVSFLWKGPNNFSSAAQNPIVNKAGTYTLTVTNPQNGCTSSASAVVTANLTLPDVVATGGTKTCVSPSVALKATSATPGVTFNWSGPANFSSSSANPTVIFAGTYTVTVTNPANGCTASATAQVQQNNAQPTIGTTGATLTCTSPTGTISAVSNTPGVSFEWTGPGSFYSTATSEQVNVSGVYTVKIVNPVNGCTNVGYANVMSDKTLPTADAGDDRVLNCHFSSVQVQNSGSSVGSNFQYQWTTFNGNIISGANTLSPRFGKAGTYFLKIINTQNGCSAEDQMEVVQRSVVNAAASQVNAVSCFGQTNGAAKVVPGGGSGQYSIKWSNNSVSAQINSLAAGTYTVTVTDTEGCTRSGSVVVAQPSKLDATISATPQTIAGQNNGTATVNPSGGTAPYTIKWNTNQTTNAISNLPPGNYSATVTDANGCTLARSTTVNAFNCALAGQITAQSPRCNGGSNGSASVSLSGAGGQVVFSWSNGQSGPTASGLPAGNVAVTVTDAAGCQIILNVQIAEPPAIGLNISNKQEPKCPGGQTGSLTVAPNGGTPPFNFVWSNGQTGPTATQLAAGIFKVTASDANACSSTLSATLAVVDVNAPLLLLKNATVSLSQAGTAFVTPAMFDDGSSDAECSIVAWTVSPETFDCSQVGQQSVTVTATDENGNVSEGITFVEIVDDVPPALFCPNNIEKTGCSPVVDFNSPYAEDNCALSGQIEQVEGLPSGSVFPVGTTAQIFNFTDNGGNTASCQFTVTVLPALDFNVSSAQTTCPTACNGTATVESPGGHFFTDVLWSNGQTGVAASGLCTGEYRVTVTVSTGCTEVKVVEITAQNEPPFQILTASTPASCAGLCDGGASAVVSGGAFPYNFFWSNGQTTAVATALCTGKHTVSITDAVGCIVSQTVDVQHNDTNPPALICPVSIAVGHCAPQVSFAQPQVLDNCAVNPSNLVLVAGLPSGSVFPVGVTQQVFRYTDAGGLSAECQFAVTVNQALTASMMVSDIPCFGQCIGSASVSAAGAVSYFWSNGQLNTTAVSLCAGTYTVTINDASGCSTTATAQVHQPSAPLSITVDGVQNDLGNSGSGQIQITPLGGTPPYTFNWLKSGVQYSNLEDLTGLQAGLYRLTLLDANGCFFTSQVISVQNIVSAAEPDESGFFAIAPNPAADEAWISFEKTTATALRADVFDASGRLLRSFDVAQGTEKMRLDLAGLPAGLLAVRLSGESAAAVKRLVKLQR